MLRNIICLLSAFACATAVAVSEPDCTVTVEIQPYKIICSGLTTKSTSTRTYDNCQPTPPCVTVTSQRTCVGPECGPATVPCSPGCVTSCTATVFTPPPTRAVPPPSSSPSPPPETNTIPPESSSPTPPASSPTPPASSPTPPASSPTPPASSPTPPASSPTPPASSSSTPPASSPTPPASSSTPPASSSTPPASSSTPPASSSTPPASSSTPPASSSTPPASSSTPPASSTSTPPDTTTTPPESSTSTTPPPTSTSPPPTPLRCDPYGYLIQNETLFRVDISTGDTTQIKAKVGSYGPTNALGYNPKDNYLYGIIRNGSDTSDNYLIQIGSDGSSKIITQTKLDPSVRFYNNGEFTSDGHFWISQTGALWKEIDLSDPSSSTFGTVVSSGDSSQSLAATGAIGVFDWVSLPTHPGYLYGVGSDNSTNPTKLLEWSTTTHQWTVLKNYGVVPGAAYIGAAYPTNGDVFYATGNESGDVFSFDVDNPDTPPQKVAQAPVSSLNDGARCQRQGEV